MHREGISGSRRADSLPPPAFRGRARRQMAYTAGPSTHQRRCELEDEMSRVLRNRVGAAALVGVLALAVTACSGTGEADAPQSGSDAPSTSTEAPPESSVEVPEGRVVPVENSSGDAVKIAMIGFSNNPYWVGVSEGTTYANDVLASYDGSVDWIVAGTRQDVQTINSAILAAANQGYDGIGFFIGGEDRAVDGLHVLPGPGDDPVHGTVVAGEDVVGVGGALRDPDPVGVVGEADHGDLDGVATAVLHRNDAPLRHLDARLRRRLRAGARRVRSGLRGIRLPGPRAGGHGECEHPDEGRSTHSISQYSAHLILQFAPSLVRRWASCVRHLPARSPAKGGRWERVGSTRAADAFPVHRWTETSRGTGVAGAGCRAAAILDL